MPKVIKLPFRVRRPILACGADLKGAFALASGREAFLVEGFGDLADLDNFTAYEKAVAAHEKKLDIRPQIIACDLHPDYFSTRYAENYTLSAKRYMLYKIQHHEAHIASAIIDNSISGRVIGVAFDGTGFGSDGNIWGGEFFVGDTSGFKRAAHIMYMPMPGAEAVIREPWRMAVSYLYHAFGDKFLGLDIGFVKKLNRRDCTVLRNMIKAKINSPLTSSAGRLFDAAGSLVLMRLTASKEAEIPIEFEDTASSCNDMYRFDLKDEKGLTLIDPSRTIAGIVKDLKARVDASIISAKFHNTVSGMILEVCLKLKRRFNIEKVLLSGGVFQNKYLLGKTRGLLEKRDFKVYIHSAIPANDTGIPIGQMAIANARLN